MRASLGIVLVLVASCRIGFDDLVGGDDAPTDAALDAAVDEDAAPFVCPASMIPIPPQNAACIDTTERGADSWVNARDACTDLGFRLCTDAEWMRACEMEPGVVDMTDAAYEWVLEQSNLQAWKRGPDACSDLSIHDSDTDAYEFRCCAGPLPPSTCPPGSVDILPNARTCIALAERPAQTWSAAEGTCNTASGRLCEELEWEEACVAQSAMELLDNAYEWMGETQGATATVRGMTSCADTITKAVTDTYDVRCCFDKPR